MHDAAAIKQPSMAGHLLHHVTTMPTWHRYVLIAAIGFAFVGSIGRVRQLVGPKPAPQSETVTTPHSNFGAADSTEGPVLSDSTAQPWYLSPRFLSVGGSVLGGFLIGFAMRVFVKTTLMVGLALGGLFSALSYFHVMNVDFTSVQRQYGSDMSWVSDQASRLKDLAIAHLPVHAGGLFGMFLGFRRSRL